MNKSILYIALTVLLLRPWLGFAQENWEKPAGGIKNAEVVIEKDKVINLRPVSRRFNAIQLEIPTAVPLTIEHQLKDPTDSLPLLQVIVRPRTMKDEALDKFYGLNAKVGAGNYKSAYALINASTKRNDQYFLNGYLNHYSSGVGPVHESLAGEGTTNVGGSGKYFLNNATLHSEFNFKNHTYGIYGYDPSMSDALTSMDLKQKLNIISFNVGIEENNLDNDVDHALNLGLNYLANNFAYAEFVLNANYKFKASFDEYWSLKANAEFTYYNQDALDTIGINRRYAQVKPILSYKLNQFVFSAGFNANNVLDPIIEANNLSQFRFYPVASIDYNISTKHHAKIGIDGRIEKLSLNNILEENPYISEDLLVNSNISDFIAFASVEGEIISNLGYKLGYTYIHYDRIMFYKNNNLDTARFDVVYDDGGTTLNLFSLGLNYTINDNVTLAVGGVYNKYKTVNIAEAWHRPTFRTEFTSRFKITKRLQGNITYFLLNGIKAADSGGQIKTLEQIHDLNIGLNLLLTERAGIFVDALNVLGSNYQIYNNYPVKGFQVIGGLSFKF